MASMLHNTLIGGRVWSLIGPQYPGSGRVSGWERCFSNRLRGMIHGLEPEAQRQFAGREDRAGLDGCLLAAGIALVQGPGTALDNEVLPAAAVWTLETQRPAPLDQRGLAKRFGPIQLIELGLAHAFLELNFVACSA
jgi:hypothetical protein